MPITRAKASQLLNQREMALYDDSRINGLRQLDGKALATRVTRARSARDRARDLVRRQKLASRERTGSKRGASGSANQRSKDKAELLTDILGRFETRLREVERAAAKARKAAAKTVSGARTAKTAKTAKAGKSAKTAKTAKTGKSGKSGKTAKTAKTGKSAKTAGTAGTAKTAKTAKTARNTGAAQAAKAPRRTTTAKAPRAAGPAAATKKTTRSGAASSNPQAASASSKSARKSGNAKPAEGARQRRRKRRLTPEEALAQTQALLEAKQARDSEPKPWADIGGTGPAPGEPGYQSASAERRARRLHAAEARLPANQGSISTRDRVNQGKRDHRGQGEG